MKKLIILFTLTCLLKNLNAQVNPGEIQKPMSDFELGQYYKEKSKNQKTAGWVLLGGGAALFTGSIIIAGNANFENDAAVVAGSIAFLAGTVSMIASIPVFISSSKNKGRAEVLLKQHNIPLSLDSKRNIPVRSVGIGITISK
jgi:hypothetical protein